MLVIAQKPPSRPSSGRALALLSLGLLCSLPSCGRRAEPSATGAALEPSRGEPPKHVATRQAEQQPAQPAKAAVPLPQGCFDELPAQGAASLAQLVAACLPDMDLLAEPRTLELASSEPAVVEFTVTNERRCLRAAAAASGCAPVRLALADAESRVLTQDTLGASFALLGRDGPFCLERNGTFKLSASTTAGPCRVDVGVWHVR